MLSVYAKTVKMTFLSFDVDHRKPVYARSGWEIPQLEYSDFTYHVQSQTATAVQRRTDSVISSLKNGKIRKVRSLSPHMYNCVGMIFSSRRAWIEVNHIYDVLRNDGYLRVLFGQIDVGDVVIYLKNGSPEHVGVITSIVRKQGAVQDIGVLSKWGKDGEIEHSLYVVPERFGDPIEYWSEKVSNVT